MATSDSPLSVPNITLAVARPAGDGGTSALNWSALDGSTSNGSRLRISSDGTYAIGTKPGGAHELHDFGHTAYERGVENTFNAGIADDQAFANTEPDRVWSTIINTGNGSQPVLKSDAGLQRHANASRFYRLYNAKSSVRKPKAFEDLGRNLGYRKLYHAWWVRSKYNATYWRDLNPSSVTGTFLADEPISVNGGEYTGVYVGFDAGRTRSHRVVINDTPKNNNLLEGKLITGLTSGATMTFPADASNPGDYKIGRWWDNPSGTFARCSLALNDGYISDANAGSIRPINFNDVVELPAGKWQLFELEIDFDNAYFRHTVDGRVRHEQSGFTPFGDSSFSFTVSQVGTDGASFDEQLTDFAEHIFDRTLYRVYLADAADWASVTHREVQRLIAWDGDVDIALNYGALNAGWIYLIGADGQPINTTGLEVI